MTPLGFLDTLAAPERRAVLAVMTRRRYGRREVIFHEGDPGETLHLVMKGHVALRVTTPRGDSAVLRVLGPGDLFGQFALIAPGPRSATVVAIDATETMTLDRDRFHRLRAEQPDLNAMLLDSAIREVRRLSAALLESMYLSAETRLLRRLLDVADLYRDGDEESASAIIVPLNQDDLAGLAGLARPTANRLLADAQSCGWIAIGRSRITILDEGALRHRAR